MSARELRREYRILWNQYQLATRRPVKRRLAKLALKIFRELAGRSR